MARIMEIMHALAAEQDERGPDFFSCPIGLDIMTDPVILVAVRAVGTCEASWTCVRAQLRHSRRLARRLCPRGRSFPTDVSRAHMTPCVPHCVLSDRAAKPLSAPTSRPTLP